MTHHTGMIRLTLIDSFLPLYWVMMGFEDSRRSIILPMNGFTKLLVGFMVASIVAIKKVQAREWL